MAYDNPYITGQYFIPYKPNKQPGTLRSYKVGYGVKQPL